MLLLEGEALAGRIEYQLIEDQLERRLRAVGGDRRRRRELEDVLHLGRAATQQLGRNGLGAVRLGRIANHARAARPAV